MAQENELDVTMRMVVDDEDLSGRVVQELQLPEPARLLRGADGPGAVGRERAAEARERGRALGREISEEARGNRSELRGGKPDEGLEPPPARRPETGGERLDSGRSDMGMNPGEGAGGRR